MKYLVLISLTIFSNFVFAQDIFEIDVSKDEYNSIVLPVPYKSVVFEKQAPQEKPLTFNDSRLVLVKPLAQANKAYTATFVLQDDDSFIVQFNPVNSKVGKVWRYKDAPDSIDYKGYTLNEKHKWLKRLFIDAHQVYYGQNTDKRTAPFGFSNIENEETHILSVKVKGELHAIKLVPVKSWRGMGHYLRSYRLESTVTMQIDNPDFFTKGTVAISLETDVITNQSSPYIFILKKDDQ